MSTEHLHKAGTPSQTTTRRSFMKRIAAGATTAALLAAVHAGAAGPPIANREMGSAPDIGGAGSPETNGSAPRHFERRTPE